MWARYDLTPGHAVMQSAVTRENILLVRRYVSEATSHLYTLIYRGLWYCTSSGVNGMQCVRALGFRPTDAEMRVHQRTVDRVHNGVLPFDNFVSMLSTYFLPKVLPPEEAARKITKALKVMCPHHELKCCCPNTVLHSRAHRLSHFLTSFAITLHLSVSVCSCSVSSFVLRLSLSPPASLLSLPCRSLSPSLSHCHSY
jgi:hypothetical protein